MGLSIRTGAGGHLINLGKGNLEPKMTGGLLAFFGSTNKRLCRRACKNRNVSYFKSHITNLLMRHLG